MLIPWSAFPNFAAQLRYRQLHYESLLSIKDKFSSVNLGLICCQLSIDHHQPILQTLEINISNVRTLVVIFR